MTKVKQKVSGCFGSEDCAHAYCRISSNLQTMTNQGYNPFIAIQLAFIGNAGLPRGLVTLNVLKHVSEWREILQQLIYQPDKERKNNPTRAWSFGFTEMYRSEAPSPNQP